jgi:hypothetical protein
MDQPPLSRAPACQRVPLPHDIDRSHSEGLAIGHGSQVALDQLQHEDKPLKRSRGRDDQEVDRRAQLVIA